MFKIFKWSDITDAIRDDWKLITGLYVGGIFIASIIAYAMGTSDFLSAVFRSTLIIGFSSVAGTFITLIVTDRILYFWGGESYRRK